MTIRLWRSHLGCEVADDAYASEEGICKDPTCFRGPWLEAHSKPDWPEDDVEVPDHDHF